MTGRPQATELIEHCTGRIYPAPTTQYNAPRSTPLRYNVHMCTT